MNNIPVFLASDNNYAPYAAVTIASICYNSNAFFNFYVLDSGISDKNKSKIRSLQKKFKNFLIEFVKIDEKDILSRIDYHNLCPHVTLATYNRFLISKLFPHLGKLIYLDADTVVLGDLKELYEEDLENYSLGAVPENFDHFYQEMIKSLGLKYEQAYFNAGVLLIDNQKWVENKISEKLFRIEAEKRNVISFADQDILNICFDNNYKILDEKYNYMSQKGPTTNSNIIIRHFNTDIKPWQYVIHRKREPVFMYKKFWHYARMTEFYNSLLFVAIERFNKNFDIKKRIKKLICFV